MTSSTKAVLVYRKRFLPPSETFVADHLQNLRRWRAVAAYESRIAGGLNVPGHPGEAIFAEPPGRLREAVFVQLGRSERLAALVARENVRLIHGHFLVNSARIAAFARRHRLPLVVTAHGFDATARTEGRALRRTWMAGRLQRVVSAVVCVSEFIRGELEAAGWPAEKLHVIPLGLDLSAMQPGPDASRRRGAVAVARLVEKKGMHYLIEAWSRLPPALRAEPLTIIGDGPLRSELEGQAAARGVPARFAGAQPRSLVLQAMTDARVFAFPSVRAASGDAEGMPIVAMEAQAMGTPVAAFDGMSGPEMLADGRSGLLARSGDVDAFADNLARILTDDDLARRLGSEGPRVVRERFDLQTNMARLEALYDRFA